MKTWQIIDRHLVDDADIAYLQELGCNIIFTSAEYEDVKITAGHSIRVAVRSASISIETTTAEQELVLKLKYGDKVWLTHSTNLFDVL